MNCLQTSYKELSSCHEKNEKKRCPFCGSLRTKRKGFVKSLFKTKRGRVPKKTQRYFCNECGKNFSSNLPGKRKRASDDLKAAAVNDYVTTKCSLSEVGKRFGVHASTVHRWLIEKADNAKSFGKASTKGFSGYLCFDGKVLKVGGEKRALLWANDAITGKLLCYRYFQREDSRATYEFLELISETIPGEIRGITTDFGRGKCFVKPVKAMFPDALHQVCLVHFLRYLNFQLPKTRRSQYYWRNKAFKATVKAIVKAPTRGAADALLSRLLALKSFFPASYHKRFFRSLERNLDLLLAYKNSADLPSNSNGIEAWNRTLERKLKNMDGFQTDKSCKAFLKLWFDAHSMKVTK